MFEGRDAAGKGGTLFLPRRHGIGHGLLQPKRSPSGPYALPLYPQFETYVVGNKAALPHAVSWFDNLSRGLMFEQPGILLIVENEAGENLFIIPF